jgi:hypothetical protein
MKTTSQTRWYEREISHSSTDKQGYVELSIAHNSFQIVRTTLFELTKWSLTICTAMHNSISSFINIKTIQIIQVIDPYHKSKTNQSIIIDNNQIQVIQKSDHKSDFRLDTQRSLNPTMTPIQIVMSFINLYSFYFSLFFIFSDYALCHVIK